MERETGRRGERLAGCGVWAPLKTHRLESRWPRLAGCGDTSRGSGGSEEQVHRFAEGPVCSSAWDVGTAAGRSEIPESIRGRARLRERHFVCRCRSPEPVRGAAGQRGEPASRGSRDTTCWGSKVWISHFPLSRVASAGANQWVRPSHTPLGVDKRAIGHHASGQSRALRWRTTEARGPDCLSVMETGNEAWAAGRGALGCSPARPAPRCSCDLLSVPFARTQTLSLLMSSRCWPWGVFPCFVFLARSFPSADLWAVTSEAQPAPPSLPSSSAPVPCLFFQALRPSSIVYLLVRWFTVIVPVRTKAPRRQGVCLSLLCGVPAPGTLPGRSWVPRDYLCRDRMNDDGAPSEDVYRSQSAGDTEIP